MSNEIKILTKIEQNSILLDLIVLSCNGIDTTKKFLDHISKNRPKENIRIIWIDNGSKDGSYEYLSNFFKNTNFDYILISSPTNLGIINGRNLGYEISKKYHKTSQAKYIMFLDNDQYVFPGWLTSHLSVINNGYDLIGVEAWKINKSMMPERIGDISQSFSYVSCCAMLIKIEVVNKLGLFDRMYNPAYFEDPDICFRYNKAGYKIGWNYKSKILHVPHSTLKLNKDSKKTFMESFLKFKTKWSFNDVPILIQKELKELG